MQRSSEFGARPKAALSRRFEHRVLPAMPISYTQLMVSRQIEKKIKQGEFRFISQACLCGQNESIFIAALDRFNISMRVVICSDCGLIRTDPRLSDDTLNEFYSKYFQMLYHGTASFQEYSGCQNIHAGLIAAFTGFDKIRDKFVIEIGCGPAGILKRFSELGHQVSGVELDQNAVAYARNELGLDVRHGEINAISEHYGKADLVILSHVLEHLPDPKDVLSKINQLLKPGGQLYIEVPGFRSLLSGQAGMCGSNDLHPNNKDFSEYVILGHIWYFDLTTLLPLVTAEGFEFDQGDEMVRAVFRKSHDQNTSHPWPKSRGLETLAFLRTLEKARQQHDQKMMGRNLKIWLRTLVSWSRRALGLKKSS